MKKEIAKPKMLIEDECTNWHVGELMVKYKELQPCTITLTTAKSAVSIIRNSIDQEDLLIQEHVYALYINHNHDVLGFKTISVGDLTGCIFNPQLILSIGLLLNATGIIVAHNHPSGNLDPSEADIIYTKQLVSAANIVGMRLLDHIILTKNAFRSMDNDNLVDFSLTPRRF